MTVEEDQQLEKGGVDITPEQNGGVLKKIIKEGTGTELPGKSNLVTVHYTGTFLDGTKFDSSKDRNEPFKFKIGESSVIKAWDLGVATMKRGEVAILTCRADYAYGKQGSRSIPPNATLLFEIECIDWKGEDLSPGENEGILREIIIEGDKSTELSSPNYCCQVEVHICGKYEGRVFEDRRVTFTIGEGSVENVIEGIDIALTHFHKGEKSRLKIKPAYAFKAVGKPEFNIPPNATVDYEVELINFEKTQQEAWALTRKDQIEQAKLYKEKGGKYFKENKITLAINMYTKMLDYLDSDPVSSDKPNEEEVKKMAKEEETLELAAHLNLSLCYIKNSANSLALEHCDKALAIDKNNEKAHFRRGTALMNIGEPEKAKVDFEAVVKLAPDNKAAANSIILCNNQIKEIRKREKMVYANMFEKFAQKDREKEEEERSKQPDVMKELGQWGKEERTHDPTNFEKENPDILMLDGSGQFKDM